MKLATEQIQMLYTVGGLTYLIIFTAPKNI